MKLEHYECNKCRDVSGPILMRNKGAIALLSEHVSGSGDDSYSVIIYPVWHKKQSTLTGAEENSVSELFGKAISLVGKLAHVCTTIVYKHPECGLVPGGSGIVYEEDHTPNGHYYQRIFAVRKLDSKELDSLTAKLQKVI